MSPRGDVEWLAWLYIEVILHDRVPEVEHRMQNNQNTLAVDDLPVVIDKIGHKGGK